MKLKAFNFVTLSFLNVTSSDYEMAINIVHQICEGIKNVKIIIYMTGHGYNLNNHDYLVPSNFFDIFHKNGHDKTKISNELSLFSFNELIKNFGRYSIVCFWDTCRSPVTFEHNEMTRFKSKHKNKRKNFHQIVFCCEIGGVGLSSHEGPIIMNSFINNLEPNVSLSKIVEKINFEIKFCNQREASNQIISEARICLDHQNDNIELFPLLDAPLCTSQKTNIEQQNIERIEGELLNYKSKNKTLFNCRNNIQTK
jgi:hypothetical protein